ncbi:MAG TPA: DNA internalization-related competence protein ComEC/Rec2 [Deltaproteobacteria bacterium]|nr:DNA internalization-related competence protein ComEC/Rec2 [Deltaproteobacteria bacterium]HPR53519.1 DNA internalization-related competence protein ComEC/Rec2 [Deltaproteobacteria bacterium]HXK46144.1 DNA internalization-related competence protein ComEC/Rec2 [Deltaproteobacteria bacterium]
MLRDMGRNHPFVVVVAGLCCGMLVRWADGYGIAFCGVLLVQLVSRERFIHALIGILLGCAAACFAPVWIQIDDGPHHVRGIVASTEFSGGSFRMALRDVAVDRSHIRGNALISVYRNPPMVQAGSRVSGVVDIRQPRGLGNFGEFDYKKHLLAKNITLKGSVDDGSTLTVSGGKAAAGVKKRLLLVFDRYARPEAELIKAMILGDRSGITNSLQDRFNSLGIMHLIAISGLNIGIAMAIGYGILFNVLRFLTPISLRIDVPLVSAIGGMGAAIAYTVFVGPEVPTLRACIMAVSCTMGILFLRRSDVFDELALAGLIILVLWPGSLYSASFQLSFSAVLGIVGIVAKTGNAPIWFRFAVVTLAAGVFTMPLVVYLFGFVSAAGLLANCIIVPFFSLVIMPLSLIGMAAHLISAPLGKIIFSLCMDATHLLIEACDHFGSLHPVPRPWVVWVYLSYIGLLTAFFGEKTPWRSYVLIALSAGVIALPIIQHAIRNNSPMCFDFLSVGQGDCSLVTEGPHAVLIDAGPAYSSFDAGRQVVSPHLLRRGITSLDAVIVTHMHPDHCGGIPYILERFPVGQLWLNAPLENNPCFQEVIRITKEKSIPLRYVCRGDSLRIGGITMDVLHPQYRLDHHEGGMDQNLQSIVVMIHDKRMKGLFMGDADMYGELILVHMQKNITADVLKVAHHGSEKSCLDPFLGAACPERAIISCGFRNRYGDPSREALARLERHSIYVYRTDIHGEVMVTSLPSGPDVKSVREPADIQ